MSEQQSAEWDARCKCEGYAIRTDYGTGVEHDVDTCSCPVHTFDEDGEVAQKAPCPAPPGNLCTDTGCWDEDRCVVFPPPPVACDSCLAAPGTSCEYAPACWHMTRRLPASSTPKEVVVRQEELSALVHAWANFYPDDDRVQRFARDLRNLQAFCVADDLSTPPGVSQ